MSTVDNTAKTSFAPRHFSSKNGGNDDIVSDIEKNEKMIEGTYLGIDFGKSKVGLALADSETKIAFAFETLKNDKDLQKNLIETINKENVETVIIGIPYYSREGEVEKAAKELGEHLKNAEKIEVFFQNEMFTTKIAQDNLIEKGEKMVSKSDDAESARIILQEWLDNN